MWWWHSKIRTKHQETGIHVRATCTRRCEDVWSESHLPINFPKYVLRRCSTSTLLWGQNYSCTLFERKEGRKHLYAWHDEVFGEYCIEYSWQHCSNRSIKLRLMLQMHFHANLKKQNLTINVKLLRSSSYNFPPQNSTPVNRWPKCPLLFTSERVHYCIATRPYFLRTINAVCICENYNKLF